MKKYIRSANKFTNKLTQLASRRFNEYEILGRALMGQHDGNPMIYVFFNIMLDPHVTIEDPDRAAGEHEIYYDGKNVGWIDFQRGMGWIDDKAYDKIQKQDPAVLDQLASQFFLGAAGAAPALEDGFDDDLDFGEDFGGYSDDELY